MPDAALAALVEPVRAIAADAGARILAFYGDAALSVKEKADRTPLTDADMAAHHCIVDGLSALSPRLPVLSEEACDVAHAERGRWSRLWLVDPLDGTREFIRRSDQFSVNIALIDGHEAVFGLIYIPVSGVFYWGYRGGGAYKLAPGEEPESIHTRALGSSLKSCLVAEGQVDLYPRFGPTCEWDTAAAQVIVEQAGGRITDTAMRPLRYNARPTLINPDFFAFGDPARDWSQYLPRRKPASARQAGKPASAGRSAPERR